MSKPEELMEEITNQRLEIIELKHRIAANRAATLEQAMECCYFDGTRGSAIDIRDKIRALILPADRTALAERDRRIRLDVVELCHEETFMHTSHQCSSEYRMCEMLVELRASIPAEEKTDAR